MLRIQSIRWRNLASLCLFAVLLPSRALLAADGVPDMRVAQVEATANATPTPTSTPATANSASAESSVVSTVLDSMKVVGFAQLQFVDEANNLNGFKVYRLRLGVAGKVTDTLSYNLVAGMVEPPDRQPHLVNGYLDFAAIPRKLNVRAGQFLVPFGLEGPEVITFNPAIERSTVSRRLNPYNIFRDVGVQVNGTSGKLGYAVAAINGTGANNAENNDRKNLVGRLSYRVADRVTLGVSGDRGNYVNGGQDLDRDRFGVDAEYRHAGLQIRGEYITRDDAQSAGATLTGRGWYLLAAKRLNARWEPVVRFEQLDPNRDTANDLLTITTLGVNYYITGATRFSVNYEFRDDAARPAVGNLLTAQLQLAL